MFLHNRNNGLIKCLFFKQTGEGCGNKGKIVDDLELSAELSTGAVDRKFLEPTFVSVQPSKESGIERQ